MKNLLLTTLSVSLLFALPSCKEKKPSIYESCCGTAPTSDLFELNPVAIDLNDDTLRQSAVYIPNIFIVDPNNTNTIDNLFMVFGDNRTVEQIISMVATDENSEVLFSRYNFPPNYVSYSWNGLRADGTPYYGKFNYQVELKFVNGQTKTYTGSACAVECSNGDFPNQALPDCFFPGQNDGKGGPDPAIPQPTDCF